MTKPLHSRAFPISQSSSTPTTDVVPKPESQFDCLFVPKKHIRPHPDHGKLQRGKSTLWARRGKNVSRGTARHGTAELWVFQTCVPHRRARSTDVAGLMAWTPLPGGEQERQRTERARALRSVQRAKERVFLGPAGRQAPPPARNSGPGQVEAWLSAEQQNDGWAVWGPGKGQPLGEVTTGYFESGRSAL